MDAIACYDEVASEYDGHVSGPRWKLLDHLTLKSAATVLPSSGRVLDAGAGTGRFSVHYLRQGFDVTLLDLSKGMLDVARTRIGEEFPSDAPVRYVEGSIDDLPFEDGAFDFVFCEGDPLSYCFDSRKEVAREFLRVLRPGGGFYVSCDNRWLHAIGMLTQGSVEDALVCAEQGLNKDPYGNTVHAFAPAELESLFVEAGAEDVLVAGKGSLNNFVTEEVFVALQENEDLRRRFWALEEQMALYSSVAAMGAALHVMGRKPAA